MRNLDTEIVYLPDNLIAIAKTMHEKLLLAFIWANAHMSACGVTNNVTSHIKQELGLIDEDIETALKALAEDGHIIYDSLTQEVFAVSWLDNNQYKKNTPAAKEIDIHNASKHIKSQTLHDHVYQARQHVKDNLQRQNH